MRHWMTTLSIILGPALLLPFSAMVPFYRLFCLDLGVVLRHGDVHVHADAGRMADGKRPLTSLHDYPFGVGWISIVPCG